MKTTIRALAEKLDFDYVGDGDHVVTGVNEPVNAAGTVLAIATDKKFFKDLTNSAAQIALLVSTDGWEELGLKAALTTKRPRYGMGQLTRHFDQNWRNGSGVHKTCIIDPTAQIADDAVMGPYCVIGADVKIGAGAFLASSVTIQQGTVIGEQATIGVGVTIGHNVIIGDRFVAQAGTIIGSDGFSFVTAEPSGIEEVKKNHGADLSQRKTQKWSRIHSLGGIEIGDDVELGANCCIDRGTLRNTKIGNGCKMDNFVQIAHNVQIGEDGMFCAYVGIAGSTTIGRNVVFGGQVCVADNLTVGDNVMAGGATKIGSKIASNRVVWGYPATDMDKHIKMYKALRRLPRFMEKWANKDI